MKMSDVCNVNMKTISTGILPLDVALGIGGLPRGKIIEICGSENSGKTTLALHIIAEMQRNEGTAVFIDAEHALDPAYTKKLGVNLDKLLVSRPNTGEECLGIVNSLISSGTVDMIVIDSIPALAPKIEFEIENTIDYNFMGFRARMMIRALRMFTFAVKHTDIVLTLPTHKCGGFMKRLAVKLPLFSKAMPNSPYTVARRFPLTFFTFSTQNTPFQDLP
jgi:recombination protein RecA